VTQITVPRKCISRVGHTARCMDFFTSEQSCQHRSLTHSKNVQHVDNLHKPLDTWTALGKEMMVQFH